MACFGSDTSQIMEALMLTGARTRSRKRRGEGGIVSPQSAVRIKRTRLSMKEDAIVEEVADSSCIHVDSDSEPERELSPARPVLLDFDDDVTFLPQEEILVPLQMVPKVVVLDETLVDNALSDLSAHHPSFNVREWYERISRIKRNSHTSGIWTSKYAPVDCCSVLGNDGAMLRLKSWLLEWKLFIEKDNPEDDVQTKERQTRKEESKQEKSKLKADCRKAYIDQDSSDDEEFHMPVPDEMPLTGFMAYGPSGVGKSAAVHAIAQEMGFTVLEINPASCKDAKQILIQSLEATQSHRIKGETRSIMGFKSLFSKSSQSQSQPKDGEEPKSETKKNTLIFIDDADVLPEGEESLLSTLETMLKKTKRPVVFTVSGLSKIRLIQTENLEVGEVDFLRQSTIDIVCYVRLLCLVECILLEQEIAMELVKSVGGDLRAAINLAQFWSSSPSSKLSSAFHLTFSQTDAYCLPGFLRSDAAQCVAEKKLNIQTSQLIQTVVDTTIILRRTIERVVSECDGTADHEVEGAFRTRRMHEEAQLEGSVREVFTRAECRSAFAQLTPDLGKDKDTVFAELVPLAGTTEDAYELPITIEDRFECLEHWSESSVQYAGMLNENLEDWVWDASKSKCETLETGRLLLNKYGRRVPQVHVRGSQFASDYWTFFRAIAHAEFLRREQEQITKRRRLRFYHYLGANSMHLPDDFLNKLSYSIGESPPKDEFCPSSL